MAAAKSRIADEMAASCVMMRARLVARVVTGMYDDVLRPLGIQASQLNVLVAVAAFGPIRRGELGKIMQLDSSTLTRNLRVMETNGWIEAVAQGSDGRGLPIRVTAAGDALLANAAPAWKRAQRRAARLLGAAGQTALMRVARELLGASA